MKIFNQGLFNKPKYNVFDLSHERKMSMNMGKLVPILLQEVVPGDIFRVNTEMLIRLAPMLAPVMHRINVFTHYFFVPNRLVFNGWEEFITGGEQGTSTLAPPIMTMDETNKNYFLKGSLADYFGLPVMSDTSTYTGAERISALPFRAYQTIYNEYYRDQNITSKVSFGKDSAVGSDYAVLCALRTRAWEKDYFTSALPWSQRGAPVIMPSQITYRDPALGLSATGDVLSGPVEMDVSGRMTVTTDAGADQLATLDNIESLSTPVNDLRVAVRLQEWLEKNARAGSRYIEQILAHFGVKSSDSRLQRPEYLGGGKNPVVISEVLSTFENAEVAQGTMSGHGVSSGAQHGFQRFFEEHGYIIGIMSVVPRTAYQQGIEKLWTKEDKFDYYFPEFAQLGEQEVKMREIFAGFDGEGDTTFGYQSRFAEYKYKQSSVHGDFRDSLAYWHLGRVLEAPPVLGTPFIECNPDDRIFNVINEDVHKLWCQVYNNVQAKRLMPYFNVPTI